MKILTAEQKQFFETFGHLALPGLLTEDIGWITDEFAKVFTDKGIIHDPAKRTMFVPFVKYHTHKGCGFSVVSVSLY
jgi:hypothetical protein